MSAILVRCIADAATRDVDLIWRRAALTAWALHAPSRDQAGPSSLRGSRYRQAAVSNQRYIAPITRIAKSFSTLLPRFRPFCREHKGCSRQLESQTHPQASRV